MAPRARELSREKVLAVFHAKGTHLSISMKHGISPSHVGCIKRGVYQRSVTGMPAPKEGRKTVTARMRRDIVRIPGTYKEKAAAVGVSVCTVKKYLQLHRRAHPEEKQEALARDASGRFCAKPQQVIHGRHVSTEEAVQGVPLEEEHCSGA